MRGLKREALLPAGTPARPISAVSRLFLSSGAEALEFLKPVLDEDQFRDRLGFTFPQLHHQKPLAVGGNVPGADWNTAIKARRIEKEPGLAGGKATTRPDIGHPHLLSVSVSIKKLFSIARPERFLVSLLGRYLPFASWLEKRLNIEFPSFMLQQHIGNPAPVG